MTHLLEFKGVSHDYQQQHRKTPVLQEVNITFDKGKLYAIMGATGSGKTTFLALASGIEQPKSGQILYHGTESLKIGSPTYCNKCIAIVTPTNQLLSYMNAIQHIQTALEIKKITRTNPKEYALNILKKVGINEQIAIKKAAKLTTNQKQRLNIAIALSCQSDLIVIDEPIEAFSNDLINLFQELAHQENKCLLIATKQQEIAQKSDRIIKLSNGNLTIIKK